MRHVISIGMLIVSVSLGQAQPAIPDIELPLSSGDQAGILSICMLGMRSPALANADDVISLGAFCAKLRDAMLVARNAPKKSEPKPVESPKE